MRIGFVGLGNMGGPMAANVLAKGNELAACDLNPEAVATLVEAGATEAASPAAAAEGADAVMLSLPMPADVETVITGDNGVLSGAATGSTVIDLTTSSPQMSRKMAEVCGDAGVGFLDAPVSGGVYGARKGTLAVMVGGDEAVFETYKPVLDSFGGNVMRVGDVGAGNAVKLVNNMLAFINMMGVTEGLLLGAKAGVDPNVLREIVSSGSGGSFVWSSGTRAILADKLRPSFTTTLASKDINLAMDLAEEMNVPTPMGARVRDLIVGYRDNGFADEDVLATVKALEEQAGYQVRGMGAPSD